MATHVLSRRFKAGAVAALSIAAVMSAAACTPTSGAQIGAGGTAAKPPATKPAPMPTYTSPWTTRVATIHTVTAPAITAYPWSAALPGVNDPYGLTERQCVSYVAWYLNSHGTPFGDHTQGTKGIATFADATTWDDAARVAGFTVSTKPVVGTVAQWNANETNTWTVPGGSWTLAAGSSGHVAIVTRVYPNGINVDLAQYNFGASHVRSFSTSVNVRAPRYIYVPLSSPRVP
jgi:surface antigen